MWASLAIALAVLVSTDGGAAAEPATDDGRGEDARRDPSGPYVDGREVTTLGLERPAPRAGGAAGARACSQRHPVCVQGDGRDDRGRRRVLDALADLDASWDTLTGALALPPPAVSPTSGTYDVYFVRDLGVPAATLLDARDVRGGFDRASAFTLVDAAVPDGCPRSVTLARELARAIQMTVAPATTPALGRAQAAYVASLAVPCGLADGDDVPFFQRERDHTWVDGWPLSPPSIGAAYSRGARLPWWWLDAAFGRSPGALVTAMWSLTPTRTKIPATRWDDEPDAFEVLRESFKDAFGPSTGLPEVVLRFAIASALLGRTPGGDVPAEPGARAVADPGARALVELSVLGARAAAPYDWEIPWPKSARRLASPRAVAPLGAAIVAITTAGAPPNARLRVEAEWEEHAHMMWTALKLDSRGQVLGEVRIPSLRRGTTAQRTVSDLGGATTLLLVGVNLGDPAYPFDPDEGSWEPHGWLLTVATE